MTIKAASFLQCAGEILNYLNDCDSKSKDPTPELISAYIYNLMTRRDSSEKLKALYEAYYKSKELDYEKRFLSLKFHVPARVENGAMWFGISYKVENARPRRVLGLFKIIHKQYFTFKPQSTNAERVYDEICIFLDTLPEIHRQLYPLNTQFADDINIKVPNNLGYLLKHPDSLVVHHRSNDASKEIRDTVTQVFKASGLKLERTIRYGSGFDFERIGDGGRKSHSELVSEVIAKQIMSHHHQIINYSVEDLAEWLKTSVIEVSKWSIEQVHGSLYR